MSAAWVAGSVRSRLLLERRVGVDGARALASAATLEESAARLAGTAYAAVPAAGGDLEAAQRAVAGVVLFHLRLLAGWLPRGAVEAVRSLAAWFELANIEDRLDYLLGGRLLHPFQLGALAGAWPAVAAAQSPAELRGALRGSVWGDPGGGGAREVHLALRIAWARRVVATIPEAETWAFAAVTLLLAREEIAQGRVPAIGRLRPPAGAGAGGALDVLGATLPARAAQALVRIEEPDQLWRAEAAWWHTVEVEAERLARGPREGRGVVVGTAALLGLDAVRVAAALGVAARGGSPAAREALDALL